MHLGFDIGDDFSAVGVNIIDRQIRKKLNFSPLDMSIWTPRNNLFMVDYILNFDNQEASEAYNEIIDSVWRLKTLRILNPSTNRETLRQMLLADVSNFEEIYEREKNKPADDCGVDRMFTGSNDVVDGSGFKLNLGLSFLAELQTNTSYNENHLAFKDRDGKLRYLSMPTYTSVDGFKALLFFAEETLRSASILFETNSSQQVQSYGELSFYMDYKDKKFSTREIRKMKEHIHNILPEQYYNQINWEDWADERPRVNARVTTLLVFRPSALHFLEGIDSIYIYNTLLAYVKSLPSISAASIEANSANGENNRDRSDRESYYRSDLNRIMESLTKVFNPSLNKDERAAAFSELRYIALWREIAAGYLVNVLADYHAQMFALSPNSKQATVLDDIYFETTWSAANSDTLTQSIGPCKNRKLYKAVMYIYSLLNNRSIDLRLIDDLDPRLPDDGGNPACTE